MDVIELSRRLENLIRIGTVSAVDLVAVRCRVKSGKLETQWLRWHTPRAGETRTWDPPTIGEQAVVLSPSGDPANGVVFYGFNCDANPPPSHSAAQHVTHYPDGAVVQYDHGSHTYRLSVPDGGRIVLAIGDTAFELRGDGTTLTTPKFEGKKS